MRTCGCTLPRTRSKIAGVRRRKRLCVGLSVSASSLFAEAPLKGTLVNSSYYQRQLELKRKAHSAALKKASDLGLKQAGKREKATRKGVSASKAASFSLRQSRMRTAQRYEKEANRAALDAHAWSAKAAKLDREVAVLAAKLAKTQQAERAAADVVRRREQEEARRIAAAQQHAIESRLAVAEERVEIVQKELRAPKSEKLRVVLLGASSAGDLRVGQEQQRIRAAVESATHRDLVELDPHPAATADIFLNALTRFRPHVVHFSGHSSHDLISFEKGEDNFHEGAIVSADAFAQAIAAVDDKPLLVLLNSCHSAAQAQKLVDIVPFAIGMSDTIGDVDAITYAARFYAAVADGQSVQGAHLLSKAAIALNGLRDHELPTLACAAGVDPGTAKLVIPPPVGRAAAGAPAEPAALHAADRAKSGRVFGVVPPSARWIKVLAEGAPLHRVPTWLADAVYDAYDALTGDVVDFIDSEAFQEHQATVEALGDLHAELSGTFPPLGGSGHKYTEVPVEWKGTDPDRYYKALKDLSTARQRFLDRYKQLSNTLNTKGLLP